MTIHVTWLTAKDSRHVTGHKSVTVPVQSHLIERRSRDLLAKCIWPYSHVICHQKQGHVTIKNSTTWHNSAVTCDSSTQRMSRDPDCQLTTKLDYKACSHCCLPHKITKIFLDGPQPLDPVWEFPRIYGILFGITGQHWRDIPKFSHIAIYGMRKKYKAKTGICVSRHINALTLEIFWRITPLNQGHVNIFKLMLQNGCLWQMTSIDK